MGGEERGVGGGGPGGVSQGRGGLPAAEQASRNPVSVLTAKHLLLWQLHHTLHTLHTLHSLHYTLHHTLYQAPLASHLTVAINMLKAIIKCMISITNVIKMTPKSEDRFEPVVLLCMLRTCL